MKRDIETMLSGIDRKNFEVSIKESNGNYSISIHKLKEVCDVCKSTKHYKTLKVRQDRRVKFFMVSKKVCRTCLPQVNFILDNLKDSVQSPLETGRW